MLKKILIKIPIIRRYIRNIAYSYYVKRGYKEGFDTIKKYCDENALSMNKWLVKIALEKIQYTKEKKEKNQ